MIMTFGANWQDYSLVRNAVQSQNSIINLLPNFPEHIAPALVIDDQQVMEAQVRYLYNGGHRKIAYLHLKDEKVYIRCTKLSLEYFSPTRIGNEFGTRKGLFDWCCWVQSGTDIGKSC